MTLRAGSRVGRFVLREVLGRGAQAVVWRAHDERLDRDVALKLLRPDADSVAVSQWLHEARAVSRLTHPHIVPVFEADEEAGQAWLVFELVEGRTLSDLLRAGGGAPPARESAAMMVQVLDALQAAHDQGLVHRDLKPSNILVDAQGRARVMDFGIAARVGGEGHDGRIVGTPGYMSPEAARGDMPAPAMDVFAAGLVLGEMLAGRKLLAERDPWRAVQRVQDEDLALPEGCEFDDTLRNVVSRALARDATQRWPAAAAMRDALQGWLQPQAEAGAGSGHGTLDFLLRRMRHKSDFPALSDSMARIQRVANSDHENLNRLADEILKDVALTNKLLRLVNSAHFGGAGGGSISTVSRAVALVGFAGIRNMALSLVLLEHMQDKAHAQRLREEFLRALTAGQLASELTPTLREGEEAFLAAMLANLGRLLTEFYFPEEARAIRALVQPGRASGGGLSDQAASTRVLGIGFDEIGQGVARSWGLPETLQRAMRLPEGEAPGRGLLRGVDRLRWLAQLTSECADTMLACDAASLPARLAALAERHGAALGLTARDLGAAVEASRHKLSQLSQAMGLKVAAGSPARRLLEEAGPEHATVPGPGIAAGSADAPTLLLPTPAGRVAELLTAGIQDVTNTLAGDQFRLNEVLRMILETMWRALDFRRVVFGLRDPKTERVVGRFGLGEGADRVARAMQVPLRGAAPDLFSAVCLKGADTLIADAGAANIASRLPDWFQQDVKAPAFLLLPMAMKGAPFALIYADKAEAGAIDLGERELSLLRTLRNQAVMAFRQAA